MNMNVFLINCFTLKIFVVMFQFNQGRQKKDKQEKK